MEEYIVPFGIDASKIVSGITEIENSADKMTKAFEDSEKAIKGAFDGAAKSTEKMDDSLDKFGKKLKDTNDKAKQVGETMQKVKRETDRAVDEKPIGRFRSAWERIKGVFVDNTKAVREFNKENEKVEKPINNSSNLLKKFGGLVIGAFAVSKIIEFGKAVIDITAKFQKFEAVLTTALGSKSAAQSAMLEMQEFAAKTPFALEEAIGAYVKLVNRGIKPTKDEMTNLGDLASSQGKSLDQLTEALLDATTGEFERLKEFGIRASKSGDTVKLSFKGMTKEVKNSEEAIKDALLSMGKMEGVAGSMEEQSKTIGGALSNLGDSWDTFMNKIGEGIAPFVTDVVKGLTAVISKFGDLINTKDSALEVSAKTAIQSQKEADKGTALLKEYEQLKSKGVRATADEKVRMNVITSELVSIFGDSIAQINKETGAWEINSEALKNAIAQRYILANKSVNDVLVKEKLIQDAFNRNKAQLKVEQDALKKLESSIDVKEAERALAPRGEFGLQGDFYTGQSKANADAYYKQLSKVNKLLTEGKKLGKEVLEAVEAKKELRIEGLSLDKIAEENAKNEKKLEEQKAAAVGKTTTKKREARSEDKKDTITNKEILAQRLKYIRDLEDATIEQMEAGFEKERDATKLNYGRKLEDLKAEKLLSKSNEDEKNALLDAISKERQAKLKEIDEKERATKLALKLESDSIINEMQEDSLDKELESIRISYIQKEKAIKEQFKNESELQKQLLEELKNSKFNAIKKVRRESEREEIEKDARLKIAIAESYGDKILKAGRELSEEEIALANGNKDTLIAIQKSKALAILAIEVDKAKKLYDLAVKQYGADSYEAKLAKAQLDKFILEFDKGVKENKGAIDLSQLFSNISDIGNGDLAGTLSKAFTFKWENGSIAESLGLDEAQQQAIIGSFTAVYDAIKSAYSQMIESQIDEKEKQINALSEQISEAEDEYNKELELQKQGYASNVDAKAKEVAALKAERESEMQQKRKLHNEQIKMNQIEIAVQTSVAAAQLIAAAVKAVSTHAGIPFVGVALGLAAAAAIVGGIVAIKNQAKQIEKFEHGGEIKGRSHSQGGEKYYSENPNAPVIELEDGEYVTRKKVTEKNYNFLEALNNDNLSNLGMNDFTLKKIMNEFGIDLSTDKYKEMSDINFEITKGNYNFIVNNSNKRSEELLQEISDNTSKIQDKDDDDIITYENGFRIEKRGKLTRRIKL